MHRHSGVLRTLIQFFPCAFRCETDQGHYISARKRERGREKEIEDTLEKDVQGRSLNRLYIHKLFINQIHIQLIVLADSVYPNLKVSGKDIQL